MRMERMVSTTGGKSAEVVRERFQYPSDNALVVNTATPGHYRLIILDQAVSMRQHIKSIPIYLTVAHSYPGAHQMQLHLLRVRDIVQGYSQVTPTLQTYAALILVPSDTFVQ